MILVGAVPGRGGCKVATIAREKVAFNGWAVQLRLAGLFPNVSQLLVNAINLGQDLLCFRLTLGIVDVWKPHQTGLSYPKTNNFIITTMPELSSIALHGRVDEVLGEVCCTLSDVLLVCLAR